MVMHMVQDVDVPRRSLKERQRQEREELILQASEEVLLAKGYQDASMDEIAARVGIAKGTLYLHFAGKEDLVIALVEREMQAFLKVIEDAITFHTTTHAALEAILRVMYTGLLGQRFQLLSSLIESMDTRRQLMEKREKLRSSKERVSHTITQLLEQGKTKGEFDRTIPTSVMLSTFFTLLPRRGSELYTGHIASDELITHLIHFYFKGIAAL
ncbi:MAG: TetR/AcrR family transcriptional regulator [Ktedonobacteraceae bacterium]